MFLGYSAHFFRSEKLKPFWSSLPDKESDHVLDILSDALLTPDPSAEYREALNKALDIVECKVVPFFGGFLRELRATLSGIPSLIVVAPSEFEKPEVGDRMPSVFESAQKNV